MDLLVKIEDDKEIFFISTIYFANVMSLFHSAEQNLFHAAERRIFRFA